MRTKRTLTVAMALVALAAFLTLDIFRGTRQLLAQAEVSPPQPDRISFGMVGITQGQTLRLSVVNTNPPPVGDFPPGPTRVVMTFVDAEGRFARLRGAILRRTVDLEPGKTAFLDLNGDDFATGAIIINYRAVVSVFPPPAPDSNEPPPIGEQPPPTDGRIVTSVAVVNSNGRTVVFIGNPGVIRGFNPQPDPPLGQ